jgi:type II secretory pathway component GspD/PulD (secretin)
MLLNKNILKTIIILCLSAVLYAADNEIDINSIAKENPFAQFRPRQVVPAGAAGIIKPDLVVETATLKFLDAKSVKTSIVNMSSEFGNIEPDAKGNSLIVCDTPENVAKILAQIRKIDRKPEQVMIEVVILDVKLNDQTEIGVNWDMLTNDYRDAAYRQNLTFSGRLSATPQTTTNIQNATAYNTIGKAGDFWLTMGDIRTVIHALQEKNNVEIIASPRVMVVSGQTASIQAVEEIPYQETSNTSEGGSLTSTKFKNVGVMLKIGATLTDDQYILLNVETEQNVQTGSTVVTSTGADGVPIVDTRKAQSSLLLEDAQTLVIGGLRGKDTQKQTNQIPFLGDIPVIGLAFKATDTIENSSELMILLSPHIYKGEKPTSAQMEKFNEITQRPLLTIPETQERKEREKQQQQKEKEQKEKKIKAEKQKLQKNNKKK